MGGEKDGVEYAVAEPDPSSVGRSGTMAMHVDCADGAGSRDHYDTGSRCSSEMADFARDAPLRRDVFSSGEFAAENDDYVVINLVWL